VFVNVSGSSRQIDKCLGIGKNKAMDKDTPENFICPHCQKEIEAAEVNRWKASQVGRVKSDKKARSSAENGKRRQT